MDGIYSEIGAEDDHTIKRRISSILKVPRTPLRDLGGGNELIQGCDVEKRQRNSRRVSFADTIRVFPTDLQTNAEPDHLAERAEARHQEPLNQKEKPETVQCEITGMNTLLHAPIQTALQEIECHDINSGREWNKMNRTLLFSEENEMDMTAGHTVMIMHDVELCEEPNKPRTIDFKSFSAELKLNKKNSEVNENSFISGPIKGNETCLPPQKTNVGNRQKIKFDDFIKSLKSTEPFPTPAAAVSFLPSEVPESKLCSSEVNASFHLQGRSNITNVFGGLDIKAAVTQYCLSKEALAPPTCHASEQTGHGMVTLHCGDESMDITVASTDRVLPAGLGSLTVAKQHPNFDYSVSYDSHRSKPSGHPPDIQQHPAMCIKTTVNNGEAGVSEKHGINLISRDGSNQGISASQGLFGSMPFLDGNKSTVSSSICSAMEITRNRTGFVCDANSKEISKLAHRTCEKQSKITSGLTERTVFGDSNMDITENQASTNANMNGVPHSIPYNEMTASKQEAIYGNKVLQNLSINPFSWPSSHLERKQDTPLVSLPSDKSAVFSGKGIDLSRNRVAKSEAKQGECQFLLSDDKAAFAELSGTTAVNYKTNRKSDCSNNRVPSLPADKTVMFAISEDMELTKPTAYLIDKSLKTAGFYKKPQEETRPGNHNIIGPATDKTIVFPLEDNEMDITKSCTVAVNYNFMQHCERDPQVFPLQPVDKTIVHASHNDMDMTKPNTCIIDQSLENGGAQAVHKLDYKVDRRLPTGSARDKTAVFSLSDENEMEITRSHTVPLNYGDAPQGANIPITMYVPPDKTVMFTSSEDMELTRPAAGAIDKSLKSVTGSLAVPQQGTGTGKKRITGIASDKTVVFSLGEDNEMEITKSCTVPVNHNFMQHETVPQPLPLKPVDKTVNVSHNDMDRSKPISCIIDQSLENAGAQAALRLGNKADGRTPIGSTRDKTVEFSLTEDNEMEITRSHTVAVNHDTTQQTGGAPQAPSPFPTERSCALVHNSNMAVNKSTSFILADKTVMLSHHNDVKITKPTEHVTELSQKSKEKETDKVVLPGFVEEETVKFFLHEDNEMEITKSLTVAVNHDIQHVEGASQKLSLTPAEKMCVLLTESETSKDYPGKLFLSRHEGNPIGVTGGLPVVSKATNIDLGHVTKDWQTNLHLPINNFCSEEDPVLLSKLPSIVNDCSKLEKKPEFGLISQNAGLSLGKELMKPKDPLELTEGIGIESSNSVVSNELKNKSFTEGDPFCTMQKDNCQIKKLPLGIFPPKLPNKRKPIISNVEDTGGRTKHQDSENSLLIKKSSDKIMRHLSPSHYISEELLPPCVEEMDSSDLLNSEPQEKVCDVMDEKEITDNEECLKETKGQKRVQNQEGEELQKKKKLKVEEGWSDTTELKQAFSSIIVPNEETLEGKNTQDMMASNMERTHGSNGSSLDSIKADSDLSSQRNTEIEAELLMDSICDQNLQEKLQEGVITVGEFFTLLQVHILVQKPRQSLLPPQYTVNASPTPEDLILSKYVYHPKLQIYNEDCQALSEIIEELKLCADNKDKLLVNVHKSLWEVMRTCSDEELKQFGAELNKMKSCFAKKSKVLAHRRKAKLYTKLVQNAQLQLETLQSRQNEMDKLFKEMDNCLVALEAEIATMEGSEPEVSESVAEHESKLRQTEQELENCKAQEEALQRDQSNLREQQQQRVSEIRHLQEEAKSCQEHLEEYNFSKWVMKEWNDQQAVFTFLYDSIELTVALGCPVDAAAFTTKKFNRKIIGMHFESLLDEANAPTSSTLVQRLIFQFITDHQCSWQEKYSTVHHLPQLLHDVSLVVSRCQLLGEEIEFLNRWGGKFNLLKTAVNDTKVKLLFSSSLVFAKFEVELSLSANYPMSPMAFTVQKYIGSLGQKEISEVLSRVPVGANYLRRMVNQIHHSLLQNP